MRKTIVGIVAGAVMGVTALTGCSGHSQYSGYDYVYNTHTHSYEYVDDSYYHSHRSLYSGTPKHYSTSYVESHSIRTTTHHADGSVTTSTHTKTTTKTTTKRSTSKRTSKYSSRTGRRR